MPTVKQVTARTNEIVDIKWVDEKDGSEYWERRTAPPKSTREAKGKDEVSSS